MENVTQDTLLKNAQKLFNDIDGIVNMTDESILKENANKDSKLISTQRDLVAGAVSRYYALNKILPAHIAKAHISGDIHYHDLDYSPFFKGFNCMLIDVKGMLKDGFRMGSTDIDTPKSITTACAITAQIIASVASNIYGGNTVSRIDEILEPYVKSSADKHRRNGIKYGLTGEMLEKYTVELTEKECFDAFQALEYEINTLNSSNGQSPFSTVNFGLGTSWESRTIQRAILLNRIRGIGKDGVTPTFPKLVFTIKEGLNRSAGDPNYDIKLLALECASKRMYPDILNYDQNVKITGSFKPSMGCRSYLSPYFNEDKNEYEHDGRNNMGVVSLNLPRIAIEASSPEDFYLRLDKKLELCKEALLFRVKSFEGVKAKIAPILYMYGACGVRLDAEDDVIDIFKNGRATISLGFVGLHNAMCKLFNVKKIIGNSYLEWFALGIIKHLDKTTKQWKEETGWGFSVYASPAENLAYRFCKLDRSEYGLIPDVTDKDYYVNSFHLNVLDEVSPFDKIDFESVYPEYSTGGHICYTESPSLINNLEALEAIWDYTYDKTPYYGTNTPTDKCFACGYEGEATAHLDGFNCPNCGNSDPKTLHVVRRICGYLSTSDRSFNVGKQHEITNRVKHL